MLNPSDWQGKTVKPKGLPRTTKKEQNQQNKKSPKSEKTAKQLLGELYSDKEYLEKLLKDEGDCLAAWPATLVARLVLSLAITGGLIQRDTNV